MNKQEFLTQLRQELSGLSREDIEERLTFYREMIDDRTEEGLSEEEAVAAVGCPKEIARQILADAPKKADSKRRLKTGEIVLLVLGAPLWLALGIAAVAVILSLYVSLWSIVISLWAVFGSLIACAFAGALAGLGFALGGYTFSGVAMIAAGIVCAGLSIFTYYGCKAATKGLVMLTKRCFVKKEGVAQ
ncbi:MAG: DUF1700 domain-containing protein [Clostridia bacterium]|nr:DUF1700 domain-containing protein [Clostridia bacterium]